MNLHYTYNSFPVIAVLAWILEVVQKRTCDLLVQP